MPQFMMTYLGGDKPSSPEEDKRHFAKYMEWVGSLGDAAVSPINPLKRLENRMKRTTVTFIISCLAGLSVTSAFADPPPQAPEINLPVKPVLETLLKAELESSPGMEVIVSRVQVPPNSSLPKHWHPGEEFGYVIEGSVILWQEGKADVHTTAGDVVKIPLKQVHTAITTEEGATLLVFRVHKTGEPERVLID
jgi:quercetin dioxygenase-like cupin family protein